MVRGSCSSDVGRPSGKSANDAGIAGRLRFGRERYIRGRPSLTENMTSAVPSKSSSPTVDSTGQGGHSTDPTVDSIGIPNTELVNLNLSPSSVGVPPGINPPSSPLRTRADRISPGRTRCVG
ncbi:unnamed protein product [Chondrus crispus]|uniref:Uncharacterized protein n=1 Tax=Chondrus crispus TaxID=2769 RepID=R7Q9J7_CHOCR|nr:unnamed protein product [Chondrus crispus]CDF35212.1 unnamed protein product [Chondrus crispus]|eukprot:XP_005715031.1 unnamed protein product [Chondrus crispus]